MFYRSVDGLVGRRIPTAQIVLSHSQMRVSVIVTVALVLGSAMAFAQTPPPPQAASPAPPVASEVDTSEVDTSEVDTSEVDTYVKIVGAAITGAATLLGLPILLLTYRKTRVEISKLELEADLLREQQGQQVNRSKDEEGNIRIFVDRSPNANIEVLADPRFLGPLLILLDFILAWILLTLASYCFSIFAVEFMSNFALVVLAAILLLPIAREVLHMRSVLRPTLTPDEARASLRQSRIAVYATYVIFALLPLLFGVLLIIFAFDDDEAGFVRYLAWGMIALGVLMIALFPVAKTRFDRYLDTLQQSGILARSIQS